jgi:hypothetical protein
MEWKAFSLLLYGKGRLVFESAGNHDLYNLGRDDDIRNRYRHYTMHSGVSFGVHFLLSPVFAMGAPAFWVFHTCLFVVPRGHVR